MHSPSDDLGESSRAKDMVAVLGAGATSVARENARTAARSGRIEEAKFWIRVVGAIQQRVLQIAPVQP